MNIRVGLGYDAHRLVKGRPLFLGGVRIPYVKGLEGHSDADVILHAVVDALLGAAGLPDIGHYFSNKDPRWKNVSSVVFLKEIARVLSKRKAKIVNLDATLLSEEPKISPYIPAMKACIAEALKIKPAQIGIKASTNEGMGFVGKKEGMCCSAVALIKN
jgi:2-C-methyl-D-erythritol 2,4-cyclodiphosphate synthase